MSIDEEDIERRVDFLIRELDEFCALASNNKTVELISSQQIAFGQVHLRISLILSYLRNMKPVKHGEALKRNHGIHGAAQNRQR